MRENFFPAMVFQINTMSDFDSFFTSINNVSHKPDNIFGEIKRRDWIIYVFVQGNSK